MLACVALGGVMLALRAAGEQVGWAFQLQEPGVVVFLQTSVAQQLQRVGSGRGRPLLKGVDLPQRLADLRAAREPLYREIADVVLETDNRRVGKVAEMIVRELGLQKQA